MSNYWKTLLRRGVSFGIFIGIYYGISDGVVAGIIGLTTGIIFGLLGSLSIGALQHWSTRKMAADYNGSVHQTETVCLDMPLDAAFERCRKILTSSGTKIVLEQEHRGILKGKMGMSWKSFGEIILIILSRQMTDQVSVKYLVLRK